MATSSTGQKTFPALIVVCILLSACLVLGQLGQSWMAHRLPGVSGLARLDPALIIMDIPVRLPISIDLILVPVPFLLAYSLVILVHPRRRELPHRLGAIFFALIIIGCCVAFGGLIAYLLQDHLPKQVRNGIESLGINADIYLPYTAFKSIHLHGNVIALIFLTIGVAIAIGRINEAPMIMKKTPATRKPARLSREQRMTPYERMLQEKQKAGQPAASKPAQERPAQGRLGQERPGQATAVQTKPAQAKPVLAKPVQATPTPSHAPSRPLVVNPSRALCQPEPLVTMQPEAVNYRPLW